MLLGKNVSYNNQYDPSLLHAISRSNARKKIDISPFDQKFYGFDLWNCYEVSWLNLNNKPIVKILEIIIPATSENIIESKSLKLYLNSFNNTIFRSEEVALKYINNDLKKVLNLPEESILLSMFDLEYYNNKPLTTFKGINIDSLDIKINDMTLNKHLLFTEDIYIEEILYSNLLKSNCLVTSQPDWASIQISYKGNKINHESLLRYLISFRNHNEFHEQCIERIFTDIYNVCCPNELTVYSRYTRRGGIDINPMRSSSPIHHTVIDNSRHIRQ